MRYNRFPRVNDSIWTVNLIKTLPTSETKRLKLLWMPCIMIVANISFGVTFSMLAFPYLPLAAQTAEAHLASPVDRYKRVDLIRSHIFVLRIVA